MEKMTLYVVVLAMFKITVIMPIPSNVGTVLGPWEPIESFYEGKTLVKVGSILLHKIDICST